MGGSGKLCNWELAKAFRLFLHPARLMMGGGLCPSNVYEVLNKVKPWAVDVSTGIECAVGKKEKGKMCNFVKAVKRWEKGHEATK